MKMMADRKVTLSGLKGLTERQAMKKMNREGGLFKTLKEFRKFLRYAEGR